MRSLSPVPPQTPTTESYVEKGLDNCTPKFVRCDSVRQTLESPYEGPYCVLVHNTKTCRILRGDKEDVDSVNRVRAAAAEKPPDLPRKQKLADPPNPCSSTSNIPCFLAFPTPFSFPSLALHPTVPHTSFPCLSTASNYNLILLRRSTCSSFINCNPCLYHFQWPSRSFP
nr:unnamed protein product [Spirometra erinaceieuropaei]